MAHILALLKMRPAMDESYGAYADRFDRARVAADSYGFTMAGETLGALF